MTRLSSALLACSLVVIAALAFVYFPRLRGKCTGIDWTNQEQVRLCGPGESSILLNSLSEIYPQAYWMAYIGVAISLSSLLYHAGKRRGMGKRRILLRIIMVNIAFWYVMLPFTYSWGDWKTELPFFPAMGGVLVGFPLSIVPIVLLKLVPFGSSWYRTGHGFGPDNLFVILVHLSFVLAVYIQWYRLVPTARQWWRMKRKGRLSAE